MTRWLCPDFPCFKASPDYRERRPAGPDGSSRWVAGLSLDCAAVFRAATVGFPDHQVTAKLTAEDVKTDRHPAQWTAG